MEKGLTYSHLDAPTLRKLYNAQLRAIETQLNADEIDFDMIIERAEKAKHIQHVAEMKGVDLNV